MNTALEDDIRTAFAELADATTIDTDARFGARTARVTEIRPTPRRWLMPVAAAATGLALIGGLLVATRRAPEAEPVADQVLPSPEVSTPIGSANPTTTSIDGLFSTDDIDPNMVADSDSPTVVASAYLDDRTRPEVLPADFGVTYSIDGDNAVTYVPGSLGNQAVVRFELQLPDDSGSGYLLLDQTAPINQPKRWVVSGVETASFGLADLSYESGVVSGSYTSEIGGLTEVTVYDAATGEPLVPTLDVMPTEEVDLNRPDNQFPAALGRFEFSGIDADAVTVRLWNTNRQDGGSPIAVFAERFVQRDSTSTYDGPSPIADAVNGSPVFDTGPISAFDALTDGEVRLIMSDTIGGDAVTLSIRRDEGERQAGLPAPYCLDVEFAGRLGSACFAAQQITRQSLAFNFDSRDFTKVLVGSIIPDAAVSVVRGDGLEITPTENIWFDILDAGTIREYAISNADRSTVARQEIG